MEELDKIMGGFDPISLEEMDSVKLLNRTDTKYVMNFQTLPGILEQLRENYAILEIDGKRTNAYRTQYFDTPDFRFFSQHHSGKLNRTKVRIRKYLDSGLCFLEVKFKSNKGRTIKERSKYHDFEEKLSDTAAKFLRKTTSVDPALLEPKLFNEFIRLTFVHKIRKERLTIDLGLKFMQGKDELDLDNLVIAELKEDKQSGQSDFSRLMKSVRVYPEGFSKYCIGSAMLYRQLKSNNFKPKFLLINKITYGTC